MQTAKKSQHVSTSTPGVAAALLDVGLGEADAQVIRFGQLEVVHLDKGQHSLFDGAQLQQRHLAVLTVGRNGKEKGKVRLKTHKNKTALLIIIS